MTGYRFEVPAGLCFTVYAGTREEAQTLADGVVDDLFEGFNVGTVGNNCAGEGAALYVDDGVKAEVVNEEDDDEDEETDDCGA